VTSAHIFLPEVEATDFDSRQALYIFELHDNVRGSASGSSRSRSEAASRQFGALSLCNES
jgi:hypothetical protein